MYILDREYWTAVYTALKTEINPKAKYIHVAI